MVQFFKPQPKTLSNKPIELTIDNLDHHLTGVGRLKGKACFVEGVLPSERVSIQITEDKKQHCVGRVKKILEPSSQRQVPFCPVFDECGGCNAQMMPKEMQWQAKQQGVQRLFKQLAKIDLPAPVWIEHAQEQGYRRVCRLAVKYDQKSRRIQLGFRRKQSQSLVEIDACPVLTPALSALIPALRTLLASLGNPKLMGHIELYDTDSGLSMLLRHMGSLSGKDREKLQQFSESASCPIVVQMNESQEMFGENREHFYFLNDLKIHFQPGDFLQVNQSINAKMIEHSIDWLQVSNQDHVLDLFSGLGNFSLPLAQRAKMVTGIEVVQPMVARAEANAELNGLTNTAFHRADLTKMDEYRSAGWRQECYDLVLLDPGRAGASEVMPWLAKSKARRIVYVSCNPISAARDCVSLLEQYQLTQWGLLDMFPHTGHVESLFLFERQ